MIRDIRAECLAHADDLLAAATAVMSSGEFHIAFHLILLGLEEVGKATINELARVHDGDSDEDSLAFMERSAADHVAKIFWAMWGPSFGREYIDQTQVEKYRQAARILHDRRLSGLYVSFDSSDAPPPRAAINETDARELMRLAQSRLAMERNRPSAALEEPPDELLRWFMEAASDENSFRTIFGKESQDKLVELANVKTWVRWLRDRYDASQAEVQQAIDRERSRQILDDKAAPKWRLSVQLLSATHSVRPKVLTRWNEHSSSIKLSAGGDRNRSVVVEFTLGDNVPYDSLGDAGVAVVQRFVLSICMGSVGLFWWHLPEDDPIITRAEDLETKRRLKVDIAAGIRVLSDQKKRRVLSEADLMRAAAVFGRLPGEAQDVVARYWSGLTLIARNSPFINFNPAAIAEFYAALRQSMQLFGYWDGVQPFTEKYWQWVHSAFPGEDAQRELLPLEKLAAERDTKVTVENVLNMKAVCDVYIVYALMQQARDGEP